MGRARGVDRSLQLHGRGWGSTWAGNRDGRAGLHGDRHPGDSAHMRAGILTALGRPGRPLSTRLMGSMSRGWGCTQSPSLPHPTLHPKHLCSEQFPFQAFLTLTWVPPAKSCPRPGQAWPCPRAGDRVIRAKVVSEKEVGSGNDVYGNPIKRIQYEIKQIKMFKGPDRDIEFIYTAPSSAICGVSLDVGGKKEYLIAGKADGSGKMHITLCDFIVPWDTLSTTQKKSLNHRYQMGCECKITRCPMIPCYISSVDECLWMDWVTEKSINGHQAKFFACIKRNDGSCAWYRGAAPPKQEFLDIQDP
uniref:Metalloproteinase inhibitor 2 n=2 Tax=Myotis TaxID=9434 RepID=A0A7J7T8W9_MYOMY|nr:TIMP metallopeptidase inhibitor 2 [Myotis myotis]